MTEPRDTETAPTPGSSPDPGRQEASEAAIDHAIPEQRASDSTGHAGRATTADEPGQAGPAPAGEPGHATPPTVDEPGHAGPATAPPTADEPGYAGPATAPPTADEPGYAGQAPPTADEPGYAGQEPATAPAAPLGTRLQRRQQAERRRGRMSFFAELPVLLLVAFVLALLLKTFLVQAFYIPSESMLPTLAVGDRVLVNKLAHDFRDPERGEVIVFSQEDGLPGAEPSGNPIMRTFQSLASGLGFVQTGEKDFIKRIVGMPGETIEMREGVVYIDDVAIPEQAEEDGGYLSRPDMVDFGPVEIPEGEYFLMGDNRPNSSDSRSMLSTIAEDDIVGRAFAVVWPLNRFSALSMPDYEGAPEVTDAREPAALVDGRARR